jgi:hypothetical protein
MLGYLFLGLLLLWTISVMTGRLFEGFVHLLLFGAFVVFGIRYITGKKLSP